MKLKNIALAGIAVSLFALPALAHHSFAMFDANVTTDLNGTVKEYEWINPHVWLHISTMDESGRETVWSFEGGSTGQLTQSGWTRETIKPGDKVSIGFHPLKDGSHGGQLLNVTLSDGTSLCQGAECREAAARAAAGGAAPAPAGD